MENSSYNNNKQVKIEKPHAIIVALPLQGHVIPTVQLALKLASKGFSITFINAENIHHRITAAASVADGRLFGGDEDIEYVTVSDGLPVEYDRSLNHDRWVAATIHCYPAHVEMAVENILKARPSDRFCLIADVYSVWASDMAKKFGLVHVAFWTEAALVFDIYLHRHLLQQNGHVGPGARKDTIDYIPGVKSIKPTDLTSYLQGEDLTTICHQFIFQCMEDAKRADFVLGNTVQELEDRPISAIQAQVPIFAIGPLFSPGFPKSPVATSLWAESDCTQWLNSKPPSSVLYVSFGSYAHIRKDELVAIANGIKLSRVNFLWALRPDMVSSDDSDPLPNGFKDEVQGRGMVVTWTSQTEVLSNKAIGGFLTHCGWNSILESIWCEVPLLCFPLLTDQFTNRKLIVEEWKIGCNLCDENNSPTTEEVSRKIKDLMHGKRGHELKEKIKKIKQIVENARLPQGSSERNVDEFMKELGVAFEKKLATNA